MPCMEWLPALGIHTVVTFDVQNDSPDTSSLRGHFEDARVCSEWPAMSCME